MAASRRPQVTLPQSVIRRFQKPTARRNRRQRPRVAACGAPLRADAHPPPSSSPAASPASDRRSRSFVPVVQSRVGRAREFGPVSLQTGGLVPRPRDSLIQTDFRSTPSASHQGPTPSQTGTLGSGPAGWGGAHEAPASVSADIHGGARPALALCEVARPRAASAAFWSAFWPAAEAGSAEPAPCLAAAASRPAAPGGPAAQPPELHRLPDAVLPPVQLRPACPGHRGGDGYVRSLHVL